MAALAAAKAAEPPAPVLPNPGKAKLDAANAKITAMLEADEAEAEAKKEKAKEIPPNPATSLTDAAEAAFDAEKAARKAAEAEAAAKAAAAAKQAAELERR